MGDSACLLHGFSYASAVPNESKQGNHMHALGESISFGRFTADTLSWERWSTFSHKKYAEEAERYARPGSVAQKKAFFEAHYKRIAAQRAAAALALLEQENAAKAGGGTQQLDDDPSLNPNPCLVELGTGDVEILDLDGDDREEIITEEAGGERGNEVSNKDSLVSVSESSETSQAEKPLLKESSVDNEEVSSVMRRTSIRHRRIPSTLARTMMTPNNSTRKSNVDEKRSSPKSLRALLSLGSFKESDKEVKKKRGSPRRLPKDCSTPLKTPAPAATPLTENRRIDPTASGRKTTGPKWHILSAVCSKSLSVHRNKLQSPTVSTPFMLRTEERAAKRKQKLEEKFNATEVQKTHQKTLKEKAGNEFRKLSCSFCFKARPLPDFYKDREPPNNQMKKNNKPPAVQAQVTAAARSLSYKNTGGTNSMPPPPPPPTSRVPRNLSKKNVPNQTKLLNTPLPERITHENASPNIQQ